ncbi:putative aminotransferase [Labilithrix luteola]|uniref:cysteine-S-conjugate beta-lyase n=1 Tax=Labilithrix luteola TaxID=1391654 RepID=A0A0K1Q0U2_9BACT|nr:aminotransferase class I/II-fold pyridoxal phosphate-dependent enzyme [Labilithrix luteola]AKU99403.1 putative aminotransferase [Labilithrix luteola]
MGEHPFDRVTEAELRKRQSAKWRAFPDDVLPAWVAEMDYPIAEPVKRVLRDALDVEDAGYADPRGLGEAFSGFALRTWTWAVAPSDVRVAPDVVTALGELLHVVTAPGDGIVIDPPVYAPFAATIRRLHRKVVETPMARTESGGFTLDLDAIERAYAAGAKAHVLCSPHNPTGVVHARETLARVAEMAAHHGVLVLSDEIHAPMTYAETTHVPFPTVSAEAARQSIVLTSASKTWNLAGLKAAMMVACDDAPRALLERLPPDLPYHAGHLGVLGGRAALEHGGEWLTTTMQILDRNRHLLSQLLSEHLPNARYELPRASYLAWIDCGKLGLGLDPARVFLERGLVALSGGLAFGTNGEGFARLNLATSRTLLEEAVRRMAIATK